MYAEQLEVAVRAVFLMLIISKGKCRSAALLD